MKKTMRICGDRIHFGLYVPGVWHIHAKTPRGTVTIE